MIKKIIIVLFFSLGLYASESIGHLKKNCVLNDEVACGKLGAIYEYKLHDKKRALEYFKKSCDLDSAMSCFVLGNYFYYEEKNVKQAIKNYTKSCSLGYYGSCVMLQEIEFDKLKINSNFHDTNYIKFALFANNKIDYYHLKISEKVVYADILNSIFRGTIGNITQYQIKPNVAKAGDFFLEEIIFCSKRMEVVLDMMFKPILSFS